MPIEISVPFRLGPDNRVAGESDVNAQVRQHVMSLINTAPGERVILGDYGVPMADMVFETDDEEVGVFLAQDITGALKQYEPGVAISGIDSVPGMPGDGLTRVQVRYLRTDAPETPVEGRNMNVAVITAGGKVSEVIRG